MSSLAGPPAEPKEQISSRTLRTSHLSVISLERRTLGLELNPQSDVPIRAVRHSQIRVALNLFGRSLEHIGQHLTCRQRFAFLVTQTVVRLLKALDVRMCKDDGFHSFQLHDQLSDLGLHSALPLELSVGRSRRCADLQIVLVCCKELGWSEKLSPLSVTDRDAVHNVSSCARTTVVSSLHWQ